MADDLGGGRAAVQEDRIAVFDQRSRHLSDQPFLFRVHLGAVQVFSFQLEMLAQHGSPMGAMDQPIIFQPFQVAADGSLAGIQKLAQITQACDPVDGQVRLYSFSPLGRDQ